MRRSRGLTGAGDGRTQPRVLEIVEDLAVEITILTRLQSTYSCVDVGVDGVDPARHSRLRGIGANAPAPVMLVDVAPGQRAQFRDPHSGRIERQNGEPVARGQCADDGLDVCGLGRCDLHALLPGKTDTTITSRVRIELSVIEGLLQHVQALANGRRLVALGERGNSSCDIVDGRSSIAISPISESSRRRESPWMRTVLGEMSIRERNQRRPASVTVTTTSSAWEFRRFRISLPNPAAMRPITKFRRRTASDLRLKDPAYSAFASRPPSL